MSRPVFVDLDGTLVPPPSTEVRLARVLAAEGRLGARQLAAWLAFLARHARLGRHALRLDKAWLAGLDVAAVADAAQRLAAALVPGTVRPALRERLAAHRAAGDRLVLLTGAPQPLAEAFAQRLEMEDAIGALCARRGGRYLAAAPLRHPFGTAKRILAAAWCERHGARLETACAYGDSRHDLALLAAVGTPVAVAPDRVLAAHARRRDWEIIPTGTPGPPGPAGSRTP